MRRNTVKAAFNYSSQLQTCRTCRKPDCKPGWKPGLRPGFRQVSAGCDTLSAFDFFVENLVANRSRFAGSCAC